MSFLQESNIEQLRANLRQISGAARRVKSERDSEDARTIAALTRHCQRLVDELREVNTMTNENKIELKPITIADAGRARYATNAITLDKYGRLTLRAAARDKLAIEGESAYVYISVDPRTKTIGIVRQDVATRLPGAKAMRVDRRGYVSGRAIIDKLALKPGELYSFEYVGQIDAEGERWHAWRLAED